jgi:hypothetical protein
MSQHFPSRLESLGLLLLPPTLWCRPFFSFSASRFVVSSVGTPLGKARKVGRNRLGRYTWRCSRQLCHLRMAPGGQCDSGCKIFAPDSRVLLPAGYRAFCAAMNSSRSMRSITSRFPHFMALISPAQTFDLTNQTVAPKYAAASAILKQRGATSGLAFDSIAELLNCLGDRAGHTTTSRENSKFFRLLGGRPPLSGR